jgi:hypothetical protein
MARFGNNSRLSIKDLFQANTRPDRVSRRKNPGELRANGYVVEAAIPLSDLRFNPFRAAERRGDFGATHGGSDGTSTRLRTYWNNQDTGRVDDAVSELIVEPKNWGGLLFTK